MVMLIDEDGKKIGEMSYTEALSIAQGKGKDLLSVNEGKTVFRIGDLGKMKFEQKQKEKQKRAQQRSQKIKEIHLTPTTDVGDINIKMKRVREFLNDGLRTKLIMKFKRQQMSYMDVGMKKMNDIVSTLTQEGLAVVDSPPVFEGNGINVFLVPSK